MLEVWRRLWDMPRWLRILFVGQVISSAGGLAWIFMTLYLVDDRGLSPAFAGLVTGGYGLGLVAGTFVGGWFGDHYGLRRSLLVSRLGWVLLCVAVPLAPTALVAPLVVLAGVVGGTGRPLYFALIGAALPADRRREGMALSRTASNLGFTVGPVLGALLAAYDFDLVFVADGLTTAVLAWIVWRFVPPPGAGQARPARPAAVIGLGRALRHNPRVIAILATVVVVDTVYRQLLTPLPLLLRDTGAPTVAYGALMALNAALIVVFEAPLALALRERPASAVIAAGFAFVGLGYLALSLAPVLLGAVVAVAVISVGEMLYKPTATAHMADSAPDGMAGRYQSLYAGASISGMFLAPTIGGYAYEHVPGLIWPVCAALAVAAGAVMWLVERRAALRVPVIG